VAGYTNAQQAAMLHLQGMQNAAQAQQNAAGLGQAGQGNLLGGISGAYPGQLMPGPAYPPYVPQIMLSDYDIELMAVCIANQHPQVEGKAACFCMLKRLEKGISKD
jgi:hypothetical protein